MSLNSLRRPNGIWNSYCDPKFFVRFVFLPFVQSFHIKGYRVRCSPSRENKTRRNTDRSGHPTGCRGAVEFHVRLAHITIIPQSLRRRLPFSTTVESTRKERKNSSGSCHKILPSQKHDSPKSPTVLPQPKEKGGNKSLNAQHASEIQLGHPGTCARRRGEREKGKKNQDNQSRSIFTQFLKIISWVGANMRKCYFLPVAILLIVVHHNKKQYQFDIFPLCYVEHKRDRWLFQHDANLRIVWPKEWDV